MAAASASTFVRIEAGGSVSCAITTSGAAECWGSGRALGAGEQPDSAVPVPVSGLSANVTDLSVEGTTACAVVLGGAKCWGLNTFGQLGDGTNTERHLPADVVGLSSGVAQISTGGANTCALTTGGGVRCWGLNNYGQAGNGTLSNEEDTPVDVSGLSSGVQKVSAGGWTSCALTTTGGVKCWGYADGDGTGLRSDVPVDVLGLSSGGIDVSTSGDSACAVTGAGGVMCWGSNDGAGSWSDAPVDVPGLSSGVVAVSVGGGTSCALKAGGSVLCWGFDAYGQLGDGTTTDSVQPVTVVDLGHATTLSTGADHSCALSSDVGAACWGANASGQLGNATTVDSSWPVGVEGASDPLATSTLTITADRSRLHPGTTVTLGGELTFSDGADRQGRTVDVTITDPFGGTTTKSATTAADGTFSLSEQPPIDGTYTYTAGWIPDVVHAAPAPASHDVLVWQKRSSIEVTTSASTVLAGSVVSINVHLSRPLYPHTGNHRVVVQISPRWGGGVIKHPTLDGHGDATIGTVIDWNTDILVTYEGDATWSRATALTSIDATVAVGVRPLDPDGTSGRASTYTYDPACTEHPARCPSFEVRTSPRQGGQRVQVRTWIRRRTGWHLTAHTATKLDRHGTTTLFVPYASPSIEGRLQRVRIAFWRVGYRRSTSEPIFFRVTP